MHPEYPPEPGDLATVSILGLRLPRRATLALAVMTVVLLLDQGYDFLPRDTPYGLGPQEMRAQSFERLFLFGIVPLLATFVLLRDDPRRYGLRLGEWRAGLAWGIGACLVMTPVILALVRLPEFRDFYSRSATDLGNLLVTHTLDLAPSEFLFRGFLMFALLRVMGPLGVVVAALPFVFAHLQKPGLELFSTLAGGTAFGWLAWRTGSIFYGAAVHVYILTLMIAASVA
ncbi:MAG: hypothetical protein A2X23_07135 [Chloroflexi bacterium GWC2_73_18]|nr:MAG: hypothetical protein A2X23_07135 [Chloroflexi bacterium GWC2_73_18]